MSASKITDPSYISEHMFDKVVREKFQENTDDNAVFERLSSSLRCSALERRTIRSSLTSCMHQDSPGAIPSQRVVPGCPKSL